jgi:hypothetical protein
MAIMKDAEPNVPPTAPEPQRTAEARLLGKRADRAQDIDLESEARRLHFSDAEIRELKRIYRHAVLRQR